MPKFPSPDDVGEKLIRPHIENGQTERQSSEYHASRADALRLLGLNRDYNMLAEEDMAKYLPSLERRKAYENIETTTNPRKPKIRQKQGIVSELLKNRELPEGVLISYPTVYLGPGTDIEYPLALGSRKIIMVDPILRSPEIQRQILDRVKLLTDKDAAINNDDIVFDFNFVSGEETVTIKLDPRMYDPESVETKDKFILPPEIGMVLGFASQGPSGHIKFGDEIKNRVVEGGVILNEDCLTIKNLQTQEWETRQLGHEISAD